jgi:hypothetical protein
MTHLSADKLREIESRTYGNCVLCAANQPTRQQRRAIVEHWEQLYGAEAGEKFRQDVAAAFYQKREAA